MAVRTTLIILGLVSLCVAQSGDDAAPGASVEDVEAAEEEPAVVVEEPKKVVKAKAETRAAPAPAQAAAVPKPVAVERKLTDDRVFQTVSGIRTTYLVLEQGDSNKDAIEVGDTPHCHLEAYVMGNSTRFFDTQEDLPYGGLGSLNWFAGESDNLAGPEDVPMAKDFTGAKSKKIVGRMPKGIDKGMMGAKWYEKRELHIPADELFGSGASSKIPSASEYKVVVWISKIKHKGEESKEYRRLAPQRAEEAAKAAEARRLGLQPPAKADKAKAPAKASSATSSSSSYSSTAKETQDLKKAEEM